MQRFGISHALACTWAVAAIASILLFSESTESFSGSSAPLRIPSSTANRDFLMKKQRNLEACAHREQDCHADIEGVVSSRRTAVARIGALLATGTAASLSPSLAVAETTTTAAATSTNTQTKQTNLSEKELQSIVVDQDLIQNQFLVNGRLTRSVYDESCTFQDEIDTYGLEQWMSGTAKLFDGDRSKVQIVPESVQWSKPAANSEKLLQFRFVEYLCFNIPVAKPIVYLSGTLFLTVSETTGLITSYREKWDQDIYKVLTSESKLFTSKIPTESLEADLETFFKANANN